MSTVTFDREYRTIDKSSWGDGAWQGEPDKAQWVDEATGLDCLIVRNRPGALCGYVGVPETHPWFGKDYSESEVRVHGGLTFSDRCVDSGDPSKGICHIPLPGRPEHVWWFGFDCAHCWDLAPAMRANYAEIARKADLEGDKETARIFSDIDSREEYRPVEYVISECQSLAGQLREAS